MLHIVTDVAVCAMDFTVESLHAVEKEFRSVTEQVLKTMKVSSSSELTHSVIMKSNKDAIANCLKSVVNILEKNMDFCRSAAAENDKLKSEIIKDQKKIIRIQQAQIGSVRETVKEEMESWSDIVRKNSKQSNTLSVKSVAQAVRSVNAEDERAKNFIMFGLEEEEEGNTEDVISTMDKVFKELQYEQPYPEIEDSYRLGLRKPGVRRPVKVTLRSTELVQYLLRRAHLLRKNEGNLSKVYLAPDRSKTERETHQKLVAEMKEMIRQDSSKHYVIRDDKVKCIDKRPPQEVGNV